jgi:phage N-6-adenine-methyltransferase
MHKQSLLFGLGSDLRKHRKRQKITQAALATAAGLSVPTVRLLEQTRGTLASWDAALGALKLELTGRNLPAGKTLGSRIAALRRSRGFSQRELAYQAEVTQPTILALERQGRGRLETLNRVLIRLGSGATLAEAGERKAFYSNVGNASTNAAWETPTDFLDRLYPIFGRFDLDPCSPRRTRPPVKARSHYTAEDDGLSLAWHGVVFVNPPYGRELPAWIAKADSEVEQGNARMVVALIPARTDTRYWHQHIAAKADVYFLKGRLRFQNANQCAPFPSAVVIWGADEGTIAKIDAAFPDAWKSSKPRQGRLAE